MKPSNTTFRMFFYTYILRSLVDGKNYIGSTDDLTRRIKEHERGINFSTKFRSPFKLIYFEGCLSEKDARRRENYLKTTQGRRFIGLRLLEFQRQMASGTES